MTLSQIEININSLINNFDEQSFIYDFLLAYDTPKSVIQRLKNGTLNLSKNIGEIIIKKKIFFKEITTDELKSIIPLLAKNKTIQKNLVRFVIITDYKTIIAIDTKTNEQIECAINELNKHVTFFLPLAGMEKYETQAENDADVKAAVQMAKLFDEIKKVNATTTAQQVHHLNIFLSRLLFCFFSEDTNIFPKNLFSSSINNHTQADGSDLHDYLKNLFRVLNTEQRPPNTPNYLLAFPYVNGGLFKEEFPLPNFNLRIRNAIIESGRENWADINPDIFGSMIQAVVTPDKRGNLGMHYTSVPNIMKVIKPLFLDELYEEFEAVKYNANGLNKLLARIANIRIFDPACGSGNFLIIAYKQLRLLEIKILLQLKLIKTGNAITGFEENQTALFSKPQLTLADNKPQAFQIEMFSRIELNHFYGIELDDFAHEIAKLSLWLAQHQMNVEFNNLLGSTNPSLPLRDAGNITQGNATRLNWESICPKPQIGEVFILGNPPYLGARLQDVVQKVDMSVVFNGTSGYNNLDYIACWFKKGADYIVNSNSKFAFVSTNSICQGEQVSILWSNLLNDLEIDFAHTSFKWTNNAKDNAGVSVSIIGLRNINNEEKYLYNSNLKKNVTFINAYLLEAPNIFIQKRTKPLTSHLPSMNFGSMPNDGGFLILSPEDYDFLTQQENKSTQFIKKFVGSNEFINGIERWCLWIEDNNLSEAMKINFIADRIINVKKQREKSDRMATKSLSISPHKFAEIRYKNANSIIVPSVSSNLRNYHPIGFLDSNTVVSNLAFSIYSNENYVFTILCSKMHNVWTNAVSGRLGVGLRYSVSLSYNTFPFPPITQAQKDELEQHTHNILEQRAMHTEKTLAELYDPNKMPQGLLQAHQALDIAIEKCYRDKPFESDEERLAHLFKLYEQMIEEEKTKGTLFAIEPKVKPVKKAKEPKAKKTTKAPKSKKK